MSVPFALYAKTSGSSTPGPKGEPGEPGAQGTNGTPGIQGETGTAGAAGTNGADGATGTAGADGTKGDNGDQGTQGIQGDTGDTGAQGDTGVQGAAGLTTAVNAIAQIDGNITITTTDIPEGKKKYYTDALVSDNIDVAANTLKVDTDATSVNAAGALMDSELTDLAGIKAVTISTLQAKLTEGAFVDGDKTKLDAIEASADVTDATSVNAAGALMDSELTDLAGIKAVTIASLQEKPAEGAFADGDKTKLDAIEASADVTDAANVAAAGALMDSELTDLAGIKAITISTLQVIPSEGAFVDGDKTKLDGIEALIVALENKVRALEEHTPIAEVGDFRAGGVVFWLDPADNRHGLVCAIEDQSAGIQWYNGSYITTGATGTAIGAGSANTTAIIASQGTPEVSYAAGLARAYGGGGFNDWFLPSKDALNQMYQNKATINSTATANSGSNLQTSVSYWSSTEYDVNYAFSHFFFIGSQGVLLKNATHNVRAVRAF